MPRSLFSTLSSWILLAYLAASLPLLIAIGLAQLSLQELTHHSQLLIQEGTTVARLGSRLGTDITNLERSARQYVAFGDEQLLALFYQKVAQVDATLSSISEQGLDQAFEFDLANMREKLADLVSRWNQSLQDKSSLTPTVQLVVELGQQAQAMVKAGNASIDRETLQLQAAAARSRDRVLFSALMLLPATLFVLWILARKIRLSWRSLAQGIALLGAGEHKRAIVVQGPEEFRLLGERLDWLRRRLHELESEKERFLRHVSHELKTPLATLREASDLLGDTGIGPLNDQQTELRRILIESGQDLQDQIARLLAYAAWRMEQHQLQVAEFSSQVLVENLSTSMRLQMERKGLTLVTTLQSARLRGQHHSLQEASENLMSNAIKHAPMNSSVEILVEQQAGYFVIAVRDHGDGVPDNEKQKIFEPFVRGRSALEAGVPGTGVGLSIVSECALAHGGEVFVEDAQPGSRFVLRWPTDCC